MKNYVTIKDHASLKATLALVQKYADLLTEKLIPLLNFEVYPWHFHYIIRGDSQKTVDAYTQYLEHINFDLTPIEKENRLKLFIQNELPHIEEVAQMLKETHRFLYADSSLSSIKFLSKPYWICDMMNLGKDRAAVISEYAKEKITRFFTVKIESGSVSGFLRAQKKFDGFKIPVWPEKL